MNRRQRRIENAAKRRVAKTLRNDERNGFVRVPPDILDQLLTAQRLFMAHVRAQGRVRITEEDINALTEGDRIIQKREAGALVLSFKAAPPVEAPAEEGAPA